MITVSLFRADMSYTKDFSQDYSQKWLCWSTTLIFQHWSKYLWLFCILIDTWPLTWESSLSRWSGMSQWMLLPFVFVSCAQNTSKINLPHLFRGSSQKKQQLFPAVCSRWCQLFDTFWVLHKKTKTPLLWLFSWFNPIFPLFYSTFNTQIKNYA